MERIAELAKAAERPVVVAGHGIRLSGCVPEFRQWLRLANIPCVQTWLGADMLPTDDELNLGILGMCGQREANRVVHDADLLIVLGSHLGLTQTGSNVEDFSPNSKRVLVNVDPYQLANLTCRADVSLCMDLREFFKSCALHINKPWAKPQIVQWPEYTSYFYNDEMTRMLPAGTTMVVDGGGTALYTGFQSSYIKEGSRLICSAAISAMGSGLPEAIGACIASGGRMTTCIIGDGSLMLNVQELQTISTHRLPIKIFVLNNNGYLAIRHTQKAFQEGRFYGTGGADLQFPKYGEIARAFGIGFTRRTKGALDRDGPIICEWLGDTMQPMLRQGFADGKPLPLNQMVYQ